MTERTAGLLISAFYLLGSICFAAGTLISIYRTWSKN